MPALLLVRCRRVIRKHVCEREATMQLRQQQLN